MKNPAIVVQPKLFSSALAATAEVFLLLALALGLFGSISLLQSGYRSYLVQDLLASGVTMDTIGRTYLPITIALAVVLPVFAGLMAVCLGLTLLGKPAEGMGTLANVAQGLVWVVNLGGIVLAVVFVWRFFRYGIACLQVRDGLYLLFAMFFFEGIMAVAVTAGVLLLRRFLNCLCDTGTSLSYTMITGKLTGGAIPGFTVIGFILLAGVCLVVAGDQLFTLTLTSDGLRSFYKILISTEKAQWATALGYICSAVANILLGLYLRRCNRISERLLYQLRKAE